MSKRVLFVGHSAHRSGAPLILLNFLRWLKVHDALRFDVMLVDSGPLLKEFADVAPTQVLNRPMTRRQRLARRLLRSKFVERQERAFVQQLARERYDLGWVNTVVPKREILALASAGVPVVCHVHELSFAIGQWLGPDGLAPLVAPVTHFVAASQAVRAELVQRWRVPEEKVSVVHEFTMAANPEVESTARSRVRAAIGLTDADVVVGGCGTLDWRKGADLFLQVARTIAQREGEPNRRIHFLWLGAERGSMDYRAFMHDVELSGLTDCVTVMESTPRPTEVFAAMDIFALTSREDPFPLVMLEAAAMRVPMVCFAGSGGGPEFAEGGTGLVVPYLDVPAFAERVIELAGDAESRRTIGATAARIVGERFTIDRQAPKLRAVMEAAMARGGVGTTPR